MRYLISWCNLVKIKTMKNQKDILQKLGIEQLNEMQIETHAAIHANNEVVLKAPTGSGKTIAFLLPVIESLDRNIEEIQVLILVPSRELAIQIESVAREMGTGYKINAVYGGRAGSKDRIDLKHRPAILIGTPGRISDHIRRELFSTYDIRTLVLDEFDKSLEIGFEEDMKTIMDELTEVRKKILTSATQKVRIPTFIGLQQPVHIDYSSTGVPKLKIKTIVAPTDNKLNALLNTLCFLGEQPGIIFCNLKETIYQVSEFLENKNIDHGCFHGDMEQKDRERSLIKFRNGTHRIIVATDLAARGLDIPELKFIIHYQVPNRSHEFVHRNGRTARMNADGTAYILKTESEELPDYIKDFEFQEINKAPFPMPSPWTTLFISGGRKDKISKGDIAGLFFKQGKLDKADVGIIELKSDCAFVAVKNAKVNKLLSIVDNVRLKKKKVRVSII